MKKKGGIIATILGVILLVVGAILVLTSGSKKTNKELYTEAVQKSLGLFKASDSEKTDSDAEKAIEDIIEKLEKDIYKITINGKFTEGEAGFTNANSEIYIGKNKFYLKATANMNDNIYNLEGMLKDNKFYIGMKGILEKVYYLDNIGDFFSKVSSVGNNDLFDKVVKYLKESLEDAIKEDNIKVDTDELTIDGKTYKTKTYGYTFTGNTIYDVVVSFVNKIKNDDSIYNDINKLLEELGGLFEVNEEMSFSKEDLKNALDQVPELVKGLKDLGNLATYTVHLSDEDVISRQITINIKQEEMNLSIKLADYKVDNYYKIVASAMGQEMFNAVVKEQSKTNSTISVSVMGQEILTGYMSNNNGNFELSLETVGDLTSGAKILIKINNNGTGTIDITSSDDSKLSIDYKIEKVDEVPEMDITDSLPFEEMTEEDKEILERFNPMNILQGKSEVAVDKSPIDDIKPNCHIEDGEIVCEDSLDM